MGDNKTWERTKPAGDLGLAPEPSTKVMNVVMLYEDPPCRDWADELWGRVTELVGDEGISLRSWRTGELTHPMVLGEAVRAAVDADILVLSAHARPELPINVHVWIDAWLPRRGVSEGVLVALLTVHEHDVEQSHARDYLHGAATRAGIDFLVQERKSASTDDDEAFALNLRNRATVVTPVLGEILTQERYSYRHWGINE